MGTAKKSDGRYVVGVGVENANEYNGSMAYRDIVIQLTEDGATEDSVNKLEYLRDYAEYHASIGEPIVPPNVSIWISVNGFSKAVEADDINVTESGFEIGGITYDGEAWDYSNAGQGGSGSGGVFWVTITETYIEQIQQEIYTPDKTAIEINDAYQSGAVVKARCIYVDGEESGSLFGADLSLARVETEEDDDGNIIEYTARFQGIDINLGDSSGATTNIDLANAEVYTNIEQDYNTASFETGTYRLLKSSGYIAVTDEP